jgi:hypothetical protein
MDHKPMRWAVVSLVTLESLITVLTEKGVLSDADVARVRKKTLETIRNAPEIDVQGAESLFHELYSPP